MTFAVVLAAALGAALANPCDAVTDADAAALLRAKLVPVPSSEMGEETAPSCIWATKGRAREVKISIWSRDELPVVGMADAAAYFEKLRAEDGGARDLDGVGDRAFESWRLTAKGQAEGSIVVLKGERLLVFDFLGVSLVVDAHAFVAQVIARS